jgi:hypothetical protein
LNLLCQGHGLVVYRLTYPPVLLPQRPVPVGSFPLVAARLPGFTSPLLRREWLRCRYRRIEQLAGSMAQAGLEPATFPF